MRLVEVSCARIIIIGLQTLGFSFGCLPPTWHASRLPTITFNWTAQVSEDLPAFFWYNREFSRHLMGRDL